jgi:DNA-binding phage protein
MKIVKSEDVLELLRLAIDRVGGQSEWSRRTGIDRAQINRALNERRFPSSLICRALKLERVVVRVTAQRAEKAKSAIISGEDVLLMLNESIEETGGITAWSRQIGINRTYLSLVLNRRRSPGRKILAALNLSEVLIRTRRSHALQIPVPGKPHARFIEHPLRLAKKEPRKGIRRSNRHPA